MKNVTSKQQMDEQQQHGEQCGDPPSGGAELPRSSRLPAVCRYVGLDLGDQQSDYVVVNEAGEVIKRGQVATTRAGLMRTFGCKPSLRIAIEVGTHSCWVSRLLQEQGHDVLVADARKAQKLQAQRKTDRNDAETLARFLRADPKLLGEVMHLDLETQQDLLVLRAREAVVATRTKLINTVRGQMKSLGYRLPKCSSDSFARKTEPRIPPELRPALLPLIELIAQMGEQLRCYNQRVAALATKKYPETKLLRQVHGVGVLTATAFILRLGDKRRFHKSRDVGPYLGMVPNKHQSGKLDPQLRISKCGDQMLRHLLVTSAQYILGPFGRDCDLRRKGLLLAQRGGPNARKRAVVAVARKLAVLLHRLWVTGEVYEPLRQATIGPSA